MSTKIQYLDKTWNFIGGCEYASTGCTNCWACKQACGRLKNHPLYKGLTKKGKWTGEIRLCTDIGRADILEQPLHWKQPCRIGVQFMGDLFHESVDFEFIDEVFKIMYRCPQHTFQILTKRPKRMAEYVYETFTTGNRIPHGLMCERLRIPDFLIEKINGFPPYRMPPNLWFGTSISNQPDADKNIPILLQIPAAVRFVSVEPMLGPVDMRMIMMPTSKPNGSAPYDCLRGTAACENGWIKDPVCGKIDQVIIGCESGPGARECKIEDVRNLVQQCQAAGVPAFVKQLTMCRARNDKLIYYKTDNFKDFPRDLQIREYPKQ